jgi:uncharacterized protein (TIGR03000 family)
MSKLRSILGSLAVAALLLAPQAGRAQFKGGAVGRPAPSTYPSNIIIGGPAATAPAKPASGLFGPLPFTPGWPYLPSLETTVPAREPAVIDVRLPKADALLWFQGIKTKQKGVQRSFESPLLTPGRNYTYEVSATWTGADGKEVTTSRRVAVKAGQHLTIDFTK